MFGNTRPSRRGRLVGGTAAPVALALLLAACGGSGEQSGTIPKSTAPQTAAEPSTPASTPTPTPTPTPSPTPATPTCESVVAQMDDAERVGQVFMVGQTAGQQVGQSTRTLLAEQKVGQVILLENSTAGAAAIRTQTDALRQAAGAPQQVGLLMAADQEGGKVQRLKGPGFDTIPSAVEQAKLPDAELQAAAGTWAQQLRQAGIDANLAPVGDVVPTEVGTANDPIGKLKRGYGSDPAVVAAKDRAFITGMQQAGVSTSVKHFPNLGRVKGNTDLTAGVSDDTTTRGDATQLPFTESIAAGSDMVMISTAIYSQIDPGVEAAFSKVVITDMLRGELGYDKVVISDDMGAAKQVAKYSPGQRAVKFFAAGGDVLINGDPSIQPAMNAAVLDKVRSDPAFADQITRSATRVAKLKAGRGLTTCR